MKTLNVDLALNLHQHRLDSHEQESDQRNRTHGWPSLFDTNVPEEGLSQTAKNLDVSAQPHGASPQRDFAELKHVPK